MLTIRLARVGKKNKAQYKIVLQEKTVAPNGRHVEILGSYDPHSKQNVFKEERIKYWIEKGAQASDTVHNLFVKNNLISDKKRAVKLPAKKVEEKTEETKVEGEKTEKAEVKTEEAPKEDAKVEEKKEEVKKDEAPKEEKKSE